MNAELESELDFFKIKTKSNQNEYKSISTSLKGIIFLLSPIFSMLFYFFVVLGIELGNKVGELFVKSIGTTPLWNH